MELHHLDCAGAAYIRICYLWSLHTDEQLKDRDDHPVDPRRIILNNSRASLIRAVRVAP